MNKFDVDIFEVKSMFLEKLSKGEILSLDKFYLNTSKDFELENKLLKKWYESITTLSFLDFSTPNLEEIFIHGPTHLVYKTSHSKIKFESDITNEDLQAAFEVMALNEGVSWNYKRPFASFDINHEGQHLRISLIHFSLSPSKLSKCFIRVLNAKTISFRKI